MLISKQKEGVQMYEPIVYTWRVFDDESGELVTHVDVELMPAGDAAWENDPLLGFHSL